MGERVQRGILISDFNVDTLAAHLRNDEEVPALEINVAPFGQPLQVLMRRDLECWQPSPEFALVWTRPESVIESFRAVISYQTPPLERVLAEVDDFCELLVTALESVNFVFLPTWVSRQFDRGFGMLDLKPGTGVADVLMRMNLRLADNLKGISGICLLNTQQWNSRAGKNAFSPKLWYLAKVAFGNDVFVEAAKDIRAALNGLSGFARKLIVLDLDETLWGGTVGEEGWQSLRLGGHDPIGEAYVDFQLALKSLTNRGVLLGIVSKNEETIALEAIAQHPEMVLKLEDFAGWRINWQDKAANIAALAAELELGLNSVVFIDDSAVERDRVRGALPDVFVPDWPEDRMRYPTTLMDLRCFDTPALSKEDVARAGMYVVEKERQNLRQGAGSPDEWLKSLGISVAVDELSLATLPRTAQLLNKTNQMNLTTRRMTERELWSWVTEKSRKLWTFQVSDKFGCYGLTGIVSLEANGSFGRIIDFVLSCRVMGRGVEQAMLATVLGYSRSVGLRDVSATYFPTARNKPCLRFLEESGYSRTADKVFSWDLDSDYCPPDFVRLDRGAQLATITT